VPEYPDNRTVPEYPDNTWVAHALSCPIPSALLRACVANTSARRRSEVLPGAREFVTEELREQPRNDGDSDDAADPARDDGKLRAGERRHAAGFKVSETGAGADYRGLEGGEATAQLIGGLGLDDRAPEHRGDDVCAARDRKEEQRERE
jgi:hypothetical protein